MQPLIALDGETLAANARAWRTFCAPAQLYAVVKARAYGWGLERVVPVVEPFADAFCVSDMEELRELRAHTAKRAIVMSGVAAGDFPELKQSNATASLEHAADVAAAMQAGSVRLGVRPAAAWSGFSRRELEALAPVLAHSGAAVSLWTHLTEPAAAAEQLTAFQAVEAMLRTARVHIAGTDVASTFPLAAGCRAGSAVRVGIGLFGATGGARVPGVRCALRVSAPVVRIEELAAGTRLGYGGTMLSMTERIATARCGYADGLPKTLERTDDILSVGMQYITVRAARVDQERAFVRVIDLSTDLDAFAAQAARLPHEIVTALGKCTA
ncbi:MAG: alanine racemase [Candidatus Baltobacteraceae bacterium]